MKAMIFVCFEGNNSDLRMLETLFNYCMKQKIKFESHNEIAYCECFLYNSNGDFVTYLNIENTNCNLVELKTYFNELFANILSNLNLFDNVKFRLGVIM